MKRLPKYARQRMRNPHKYRKMARRLRHPAKSLPPSNMPNRVRANSDKAVL
jgi:hypothetical protein